MQSIKFQVIVLVLVSIALNINTLFNDYALDDIVVMTQNSSVQKGVHGIAEILKNDYTHGYTTQNLLSGARYRPLSLAIFALEYQLFHAKPFISHLINLLLFVFLIVLLYQLLHTYLFKEQHPYLSFLSCLLFAVHPIHTEVIANVKGRDEIITFIFLIISLITFIKYISFKKIGQLLTACTCFFLALLTKETAVTYLGVVPLILYFFINKTVWQSLLSTVPFVLVFAAYMLLRYQVVGFDHHFVNDVANAPYLYASPLQAFATKVFILYKYISLLVFPNLLTSDYGFNQVPYITIKSFEFSLSFLLIVFLLLIAYKFFRSRSVISFCILYFFITLSVGTNFVFDFGAILAERMLFQPSLAFCILISLLFLKIYKQKKLIPSIALAAILFFFSFKTIARNSEWKNNETLFLADVKSSPQSARLNLYACEQFIIKANKTDNYQLRNEYLHDAIYYGERSMEIHNKFAYTYLRLGLAYYYSEYYVKASDMFRQAYRLEPNNADAKKWSEYLQGIVYIQSNEQLNK